MPPNVSHEMCFSLLISDILASASERILHSRCFSAVIRKIKYFDETVADLIADVS